MASAVPDMIIAIMTTSWRSDMALVRRAAVNDLMGSPQLAFEA